MKKIVASIVGLSVVGAMSAAKNRFAPWWGELFSISCKGVHMYLKKLFAPVLGLIVADIVSAAKMQSLLLTLMVVAFWVSPAAVAADKKMVTDPSTGKMVTAPEYGGTITLPYVLVGDTTDYFVSGHYAGFIIDGVNEQLACGDWGLDREEYDFRDSYVPTFAFARCLAESWETPDPLTYIFHIRQEVHWHDKPPMNGRELTADDVVYTFQRNSALGDFTEDLQVQSAAFTLPWESVEATDKYTVVMKMTEPSLGALRTIITQAMHWILPPEVIEQHGDYADWRNVVGTGPMMLTDYVEGVSKTYTRNPDYWGYDEKYPENRLPYLDEVRRLYMAEEATRISALRSGKVDMLHQTGGGAISSLDVVRSLQRTNPDIEISPYVQGSYQSFTLNIRNAPIDDIRVRHALQMALDLETISDTYYAGYARWKDPSFNGVKGYYTPFEEWPEELKQYYRYDPEGAEKLLDEAGYPRGADGVRFKVIYDHRDIMDLGYAEIAAGYWADIGVDVTINIVDTATIVAKKAEANYEMISGNLAMITSPSWTIGTYRAVGSTEWFREWTGGADTPELTAAYDAFQAATTEEGQMKAHREWDMVLMKQHNQIWGPLAPKFQANQPWVKGFNGEFSLGDMQYNSMLYRLWLDQELKDRTQ